MPKVTWSYSATSFDVLMLELDIILIEFWDALPIYCGWSPTMEIHQVSPLGSPLSELGAEKNVRTYLAYFHMAHHH